MQSSQNKTYAEIAYGITKILRDYFLDKEGILILGFKDGKIINQQIIDDFGDVAPFIALYGGEDICEHHINYISERYDRLNFTRAFAYTDLILGLIWYSKVGKFSTKAMIVAESLADYIEKNWYRAGRLYSVRKFNVLLPVTYGIDSTFIEVWTELYRSTKKEKYLKLALMTAEFFHSLSQQRDDYLVPQRSLNSGFKFFLNFDFLRKFNKAKIMKDNSNYCFALLDIYRQKNLKHVKEMFDETFNTLADIAGKDSFGNEISSSQQPSGLMPSFAFVVLACDAYQLFKDKSYLKQAIVLADAWLLRQSKTTGLMPEKTGLTCSYFDCETDMGIALCKLYECTGRSEYKESAKRLAEGVIAYHTVHNGFVMKVDINDGHVVNSSIKTKFVALFIKLLHVLETNSPIYGDEKLFMLMKDR